MIRRHKLAWQPAIVPHYISAIPQLFLSHMHTQKYASAASGLWAFTQWTESMTMCQTQMLGRQKELESSPSPAQADLLKPHDKGSLPLFDTHMMQ